MEKPAAGAEHFRFDRIVCCEAASALSGVCLGSALCETEAAAAEMLVG